MITETITYVDFNGEEQTETAYFNLTESELMRFNASIRGGLKKKIEKFENTKDQDPYEILSLFEDIVLRAYGRKSEDGKRFEKAGGMLAEEFAETAAYAALIMKFIKNPDLATKFINGLAPNIK